MSGEVQSAAIRRDQGRSAAIRRSGSPVISCDDVGVQIGSKWLLREVSFELWPGTMTALVGPNGAGKTTMLSLLAGDRRPDVGELTVAGKPPTEQSARQLAKLRSVMRQTPQMNFAFSVAEVVSLGRMPWPTDRALDPQLVTEALAVADISDLADRDVTTLSGGESARVAFARTVVQAAPVILLDEPTAALDLRHQQALLSTAGELRNAGGCVVVVLHDLNLAARHADRILMFDAGALVADGSPAEVLTASAIEQVYRQPVAILTQPDTELPLVVALPDPARVGLGPALRSQR